MDNWIEGWKRKGWKTSTGADVKNRADLEQLDGLMQKIEVGGSFRYYLLNLI